MKKILFSKCSNDRSEKFRIVTKIVEENGKKWVEKHAWNDASVEHIKRIEENYKKLVLLYDGYDVEFAKTTFSKGFVKLEWIEGETFAEYLDHLLESNREKEALILIKKFFSNIFRGMEITEKIQGVDVDVLFSNTVYKNGKWFFYDFEWFFDTLVEIKYIAYRCIKYYLNTQFRIEKIGKCIWESFLFTSEEKGKFDSDEEAFQRYVEEKHFPLWRLYGKIHGKVTSIIPLYEQVVRERTEQVFYDDGSGFSEEKSCVVNPLEIEKNKFVLEYNCNSGYERFRFDPAWAPCYVSNVVIQVNGKKVERYRHNGNEMIGEGILFLHCDPQLWFEIPEEQCVIIITYERIMISSDDFSWVSILNGKIAELEQANLDRRGLIEQRAEMEKDIRMLLEQKHNFEIKISELDNQLNFINEKLFELEKERDHLKEEKESATKIIAEIYNIKEILVEEKNELICQKENAEEELNRIKQSRVWKVFGRFNKDKSH